MGADMRSVHPDIGVMEHGAEAQEYAIADPTLRQLEGAAVDSDPGSAAPIVKYVLPRALFYFRWAAVLTKSV